QVLQAGRPARYFMLHKPMGCVSATVDAQHPTVLDLLDEPDKHELHLAGRLDYNTSGLMLITNDGQWSRRLTQPQTKLGKVYYVETEQVIDQRYVDTFAQGIYFSFEDLTTQPAELVVLGPHSARLTIVEGRYHQVKRMFGHFQNKVLRLHREQMGPLTLDPELSPGQYRALTAEEIQQI
ncbi:16S rRNA pseudouridine(516) synthase, partial [Pseudomonas sp.]|uniref:16S rRNA pseudouridine(516) synthase n=1 Tax=Pseudomonas sp. TaxID=306 RepID=UPI00258912D8